MTRPPRGITLRDGAPTGVQALWPAKCARLLPRMGRGVHPAAGGGRRPIVEGIGAWGIRWIGEIGDQDLDPKLLLWDMHRNVDHSAIPRGRSVVEFNFSDVAPAVRTWWLVLTTQEAD